MFDSGVTANDFISALKSETDIAPDIPDSYFIDWLNYVEQTLYDNVIREERVINKRLEELCNGGDHDTHTGEFSILYSVLQQKISGDAINADIALTRYEDITSIIINNRKLSKVKRSAWNALIFPYTYCDGVDRIMIYLPGFTLDAQWVNLRVKIAFTVRPAPKSVPDIDTTNVMVPPEFLDMVRAKLRGEAYKFANEDALAAKWLNDYNQQLEYFRAWIASKSPTFGA